MGIAFADAVLMHEDCDAINTAENPDNLVPHADGKTTVAAEGVHAQLPPIPRT